MSRPPVRWADTELPEHLSSVLESARLTPDADAAALDRMRTRLRGSLGPGFEQRAVSRSKGLWRGKWLASSALVVVGLSLLGVRALQPAQRELAQAAAAANSGNHPRELAQAAAAAHELAFGREHGTQGDHAASAPDSEQRTQAESAQPVPRPVAPTAPKHAARSSKRRAPAASRAGLAEELRGIEQIRQLLKTSPTRALAAAEEQQQRFAHGALTPERELLRVEALVRAGRIDEARARAASSKPYREQLEKLLAAQKN